MRRYLLFAGSAYYADGGWNDWHGDFDSIEEALVHRTTLHYDWWHIVDITTKAIVEFGYKSK